MMLNRSVRVRLNNSRRMLHSYKGNGSLAIVREEYGMWERRAPLSPKHVSLLSREGFKVLVQPCARRVFANEEYERAGAIVTEDISSAPLILGVKKMDFSLIQPGKTYIFFSHVIKAQPANMKLLDHVVDNHARLFDYECITAQGRDDTPRLVAFGKFAGHAGMIDGLQGLGQRLLAEGYSTPFLNVPMSFMHEDLDKVEMGCWGVGVREVGGGVGKRKEITLSHSFPHSPFSRIFLFSATHTHTPSSN